MDSLMRQLAPITDAGWDEIEEEAKSALKTSLAGRKLVDFKGPLGWETGVVDTGRTKALKASPAKGVRATLREARTLVELRVPFTLSRRELEAFDRGAPEADLDPVREAAITISRAEDNAIFHGFAAGNITGVMDAAKAHKLDLTDDFEAYPAVVAEALRNLRAEGVSGPYAIALGPRCYAGLSKTVVGGYPVYTHVERMVDGPIVSAPAVDGACVMSLRGGDFELTVGRDFSIGYLEHTADEVTLYIEESFTFQPVGPEAAVPLVYKK